MIRNSDHCASVWRPKSVNRQRSSVVRERRALQAELDRVSKQIDKLVGAIMQGADAFALNAKLLELEKQKADIEASVVAMPDAEPLLHPGLANIYPKPTFA